METGVPDLRTAERGQHRRYLLILLGMLALMLITRILTVRHSMEMHSDEWVFFTSASSVSTPPAYAFAAAKDYPNGAFVFQMPFQFLARSFSLSGIVELSQRLVGRLASICYFALGCALGLRLVWKHSGKRLIATAIYALIMVFSLFQIEQSRYGTGDAISMFVLMGILSLQDLYDVEGKTFYLYAAACCVGVLAAVKFPLMFFLLLPIGQRCLRDNGKSRVQDIVLILLFALVGLLAFSPQFFQDPTFFMRAFFNEFGAYVGEGGDYTPAQNLLSTGAFAMLYADVLLGPLFGVLGIVTLWRREGKQSIYRWLLPAAIWIFFFYNLLTRWLFLRTYMPFVCLNALYIAIGMDAFATHSRWRKAAVGALTGFLVLRGGLFIQMLASSPAYTRIPAILASQEGWADRIDTAVFGGNQYTSLALKTLPEKVYAYQLAFYRTTDTLEDQFPLFPGEFGVTTHQGSMTPATGDADSLIYLGETGSDFQRYFLKCTPRSGQNRKVRQECETP